MVEAGEEQEEGSDYFINAGTERLKFRGRRAGAEADLGSDYPINCLVWNGIPIFIIDS